jgi:hypothetical protein
MAGEWAVGFMSGARPVLRAFHVVEAGLTMFFANVLTLMLGMLIALSVTDRDISGLAASLSGAAAGMWLVLDVPYLWRVWRMAFGRSRDLSKPYAFDVASRQRVLPVGLRPVVVAWWLAHFAFGAWAAVYTHTITEADEPGLGMPLKFLVVTSYGFAANGYLMLAVCAATRSERVRAGVWRARGVVDIALGVVGAVLPPAKSV